MRSSGPRPGGKHGGITVHVGHILWRASSSAVEITSSPSGLLSSDGHVKDAHQRLDKSTMARTRIRIGTKRNETTRNETNRIESKRGEDGHHDRNLNRAGLVAMYSTSLPSRGRDDETATNTTYGATYGRYKQLWVNDDWELFCGGAGHSTMKPRTVAP